MKTRKKYSGEVHHVCQQTVQGVLVFYTISDYLVFFTIFCSVARRLGIRVLALCPMVDHIHNTVVVPSERLLPAFVQQYTHLFSHEWNLSRGRKGVLFKHRYMSSAKLGNKQVKTTINYNCNNPVERKMVQAAEDYRWNFLRYAKEEFPFSVPYKLADKSAKFRNILKEIKCIYDGGGYLKYRYLKRWKAKLNPIEIQQLTDYAIHLWNVVDYEEAVSYYGDYETMLHSFHDNTGSDYDIKEDRNNYSDAVYKDCSRILIGDAYVKNLFEIPLLPLSRKKYLAELLHYRTTARPRQIEKYLHLQCGS